LPTDQNLYSAQVHLPHVRLRVRHAAWNVLHYQDSPTLSVQLGAYWPASDQVFQLLSTESHSRYTFVAQCTLYVTTETDGFPVQHSTKFFSDVKADQFIPCEVRAVT
jgi:hypothetical protein